MNICFYPGRESSYPRTQNILRDLRAAGMTVYDCSVKDRGPIRYIRSFWNFMTIKGRCDLIWAGFLGQPLIFAIRLFTRKIVVLDAFVSVYMTLVHDRRTIRARGVLSRIAWLMDSLACRLADRVVTDTRQHISYFVGEFSLDQGKFDRVFVGTDERLFYPRNNPSADFLVHVHGEFQNLHGLADILGAAQLLPDVAFQIIGKGKEFRRGIDWASRKGLKNVAFLNHVPYEQLPSLMSKASVCLGIFGTTLKARMVIPNKIFEALAMKKPVVTLDTPAIRELLKNGESALLTKSGHPEDIALAIRDLQKNESFRNAIARNGFAVYRDRCSAEVLRRDIGGILAKLTGTVTRNRDM